MNKNQRIIGIWGYPHPDILKKARETHPAHKITDLDINAGFPSSNILPDTCCKIIMNIIDNAVWLKDSIDFIIASVGEEKCDSARLISIILKDMGFKIIQTTYTTYNNEIYTPISVSNMPLKDKICKIMDKIINPVFLETRECKPTFGFWGVPPNDMSILELFPDATHVFGWTRCVEAKRPADIDLEMFVDESVPTVFFAQTFCAKMQTAKYLARKYDGLYVDIDDKASNSVKAKIEAFIKLS
ncbi:MAG: hypothetical protein V2B14_02530 [bacterium]